MYEDKVLVCKDCGQEFTFTAGEQAFYAERGFENEPQRCKPCRDARKNQVKGQREYHISVCANAVKKQEFHSNQEKTDLYCAANVSQPKKANKQ